MKADEIRKALDPDNDQWDNWPLYSGSNGAIGPLLVEIAAQLAELNAFLRGSSDQGVLAVITQK